MIWIDIDKQKPTLEDCGKEYLVAILLNTRYEYQIAEWFNPEDVEREPFFLIEHSWAGQHQIIREVKFWTDFDLIELQIV